MVSINLQKLAPFIGAKFAMAFIGANCALPIFGANGTNLAPIGAQELKFPFTQTWAQREMSLKSGRGL